MNYSKEFKEESLKLSDEIGTKKAAEQFGLKYYTLDQEYQTGLKNTVKNAKTTPKPRRNMI